RVQQRVVRSLLEDVALRARLQAAAEELALAVGGEDQDRHIGNLLRQDLRRLEPVHPGHADVHDDDVWPAPFGQGDRRLAVGSLAYDADVRRAREREAQALADDLVVVDDQACDLPVGSLWWRLLWHGTRIVCGRSESAYKIRVSCSASGSGRMGRTRPPRALLGRLPRAARAGRRSRAEPEPGRNKANVPTFRRQRQRLNQRARRLA